MKITLEPTDSENFGTYSKVVISVENDDLELRELWDDLIEPAILAATYQPESIESLILGLAYEIEDRANRATWQPQ